MLPNTLSNHSTTVRRHYGVTSMSEYGPWPMVIKGIRQIFLKQRSHNKHGLKEFKEVPAGFSQVNKYGPGSTPTRHDLRVVPAAWLRHTDQKRLLRRLRCRCSEWLENSEDSLEGFEPTCPFSVQSSLKSKCLINGLLDWVHKSAAA